MNIKWINEETKTISRNRSSAILKKKNRLLSLIIFSSQYFSFLLMWDIQGTGERKTLLKYG